MPQDVSPRKRGFAVKTVVAVIAALLAIAVAGKLALRSAPGIASPAAGLPPEVRLAQARAAIKCARAEAESINDDQGKAAFLGSIAAAQAGAGDVTASRQTFAQALQIAQGIKDDTSKAEALGSIGASQAAAGDLAASRQTLAQASQTAQSIGYGPLKNLALRAIAVAQAKAGDLSGGLRTAQSIKEDFLKVPALKSVAAAQAKAGDATASRQTFTEAIQAALGITDEDGLAKEMNGDAIFKDQALESIAGAQADAGDLRGGFQTAKSISDDSTEAQALGLVGAAQAKAGAAADSRETFRLALETGQSVTDGYSKADALRALAVAQAAPGEAAPSAQTFAQAIQTAQSITDDHLKALALSLIGAAQAKAGNGSGGRQTVTKALQAARNIRSDGPDDTLESIAVELAKAGDVSDALQIAHGIKDGTLAKAWILNAVVTAQVAAADIAGAQRTVGMLAPGEDRCAGYIKIAEALLKGPHASDGEEEP